MRTLKSITIQPVDAASLSHKPLCWRYKWVRRGRRGVMLLLLPWLLLSSSLVETPVSAATPALGGDGNARELASLGGDIMASLRRRNPVLHDPVTTAYLDGLVSQLRGANALPLAVESITVFKNLNVNAFVLPGGYVGVNAGLVLAAPNESALASVLAHEIAHLTQRHVERRFARQSGAGVAALVGILAGALVARESPDAAQAAIYSGIASSTQQQLDYSRENEREADRVGQKLLENAGFRSAGTAEMLQRMAAMNAINVQGGLEYLQTHPLTPNRIGEAWERAERAPSASNPEDAIGFNVVKTRVASLLGQTVTGTQQRAYASALSALERNPARSLELLDTLEQPWRDARFVRLLRAEALFRGDRIEDAVTAYNALKTDYPNDFLTHLSEATQRADAGDPTRAAAILAAWLRRQPAPYPDVLRLTAQFHQSAGLDADAQRWLADYHLMRGDSHRAAVHLRQALTLLPEDSNQAAQVRAQLDTLNLPQP